MSLFSTHQSFTARALALGLLLAACGSSGPTSGSAHLATTTVAPAAQTTTTLPAYPVTVSSAQGQVTLKSRPKAIVSLSPTATEDLFAIGAGPQVVAVDDQSNYPPNAPRTDLSGFKPNVEAIAAKKPDLVVVSEDGGLSAALIKIEIPVLVEPAANSLDEAYSQVKQLGAATGHAAQASQLVASMRDQISQLVASLPHRAQAPRIYHELDQTLYTATSSTFIGQLYRLLGADDIADAADKTGSGYPQLSAEYVVNANPSVIFLADTKCCQQNLASVAARPGWSGIAAVKAGAVVALDDDIASRWGPRIVDLLRTMTQALAKVPAT